MKGKDIVVCVRFSEKNIKRIDDLINEEKFDNRSSFIRRAVIEYLNQLEIKILA